MSALGMQFGMHLEKTSPHLVALVLDFGAQDVQRCLDDLVYGVRQFFGLARRDLAPRQQARVAHKRQVVRDLGGDHVRMKPSRMHVPANR